MKTRTFLFGLILIAVFAVVSCSTAPQTAGQQQQQTAKSSDSTGAATAGANHAQQHHGHDSHLAGVEQRGDQAMGFSHQKTTHRFRLFENGGAIEVTANSENDVASSTQIRTHLQHISRLFPAGDFNAPMLTHGNMPPGVPVLQKLKSEIVYQYEEMPSGARVRILTNNPEALAAVHDFLRFQIADHQTGDPVEIARQ